MLEKKIDRLVEVLSAHASFMSEQVEKRDRQLDKLMTIISKLTKELGDRGKESDDRMRLTNSMIHELIEDNANTHKAYTHHLQALEEDRDALRAISQKQAEDIGKLLDREKLRDKDHADIVSTLRELLRGRSSENNFNFNKHNN